MTNSDLFEEALSMVGTVICCVCGDRILQGDINIRMNLPNKPRICFTCAVNISKIVTQNIKHDE